MTAFCNEREQTSAGHSRGPSDAEGAQQDPGQGRRQLRSLGVPDTGAIVSARRPLMPLPERSSAGAEDLGCPRAAERHGAHSNPAAVG